MTKDASEIPLATSTTKERLSDKQLVDYNEHRRQFREWLDTRGKSHDNYAGYSHSVVRDTMYRTDSYFRWVWDQEGGYTMRLSHEHGDQYLIQLAQADKAVDTKASEYRCLKRLYEFYQHFRNLDEWEPEVQFSNSALGRPRDFLTLEERGMIQEAALDYGSIPGYNDLTPEERDRWKIHLAQRFEKPKSEVTPDDWDRANGWKFTSLVWVSLDTGLRPVEVERSKLSWIDLHNQQLRIPAKESSKNRDNWTPTLRERTVTSLEMWLAERENYELYDGREEIWLTREGNPYTSQSLRYLLHQLCEEAGIPLENRQMSWYAIRHHVGTYMTHMEDLGATKEQLRHQDPKTTMRYANTPPEIRRQALEKMG